MQGQLCVGRRKYAFIDEQLTESHAVRKVDAEHIKRDTPDWRLGFEFRADPSEVFVPRNGQSLFDLPDAPECLCRDAGR